MQAVYGKSGNIASFCAGCPTCQSANKPSPVNLARVSLPESGEKKKVDSFTSINGTIYSSYDISVYI